MKTYENAKVSARDEIEAAYAAYDEALENHLKAIERNIRNPDPQFYGFAPWMEVYCTPFGGWKALQDRLTAEEKGQPLD